jgi:hypothetical protein
MVRLYALSLATATCVAIAMLVATACITAPPPQLPQEVAHRPTIMHESVQPPAGLVSFDLPSEFLVPVVLEDPNETFQWDVFIDYNDCADPSSCTPTPPLAPGIQTVAPTPGTLDGGVEFVSFIVPPDLDPSRCHNIDFLVAHKFETSSTGSPLPRTWDPVGGDIVTWTWDPAGTVPCDLVVYDAGALQDGAFPPADAGTEALPAVPESGTD